jgi:hypothetical protein
MSVKYLIGATLISFGIAAQATPTITISAQATAPGFAPIINTTTVNSGQNSVQSDTSDIPLGHQNSYAAVTADDLGNFGMSSSVNWRGEAISSYSYLDTVTNTGFATSNYSFSFHVPVFNLSVQGHNDPSFGDSYAESFYNYNILVNGLSIFSSSGGIWANYSGDSVIDTANDQFGLLVTGGPSSFNGVTTSYDGTVMLGELSAGQSLVFEVLASITARRVPDAYCSEAISDCFGSAGTDFSDPFNVTAEPGNFSIVPGNGSQVNDVPEPATGWLMLLPALYLLRRSFARRRDANAMQ